MKNNNIRNLKSKRTKLLKKIPETIEEFNIIQDELNKVELELKLEGVEYEKE